MKAGDVITLAPDPIEAMLLSRIEVVEELLEENGASAADFEEEDWGQLFPIELQGPRSINSGVTYSIKYIYEGLKDSTWSRAVGILIDMEIPLQEEVKEWSSDNIKKLQHIIIQRLKVMIPKILVSAVIVKRQQLSKRTKMPAFY